MLRYVGDVAGIKEKTYEGKTTYTLQFVDTRGDELSFEEVKLEEGMPLHKSMGKGSRVNLPVIVNFFSNKKYMKLDFTAYTDEMQGGGDK